MSETIFSAQTGDGDSAKTFTQGKSRGTITVVCDGTFDGATVKLQFSKDGSVWVDDTDFQWTSAGALNMDIAPNVQVKGNVASAGGSTSIDLDLVF